MKGSSARALDSRITFTEWAAVPWVGDRLGAGHRRAELLLAIDMSILSERQKKSSTKSLGASWGSGVTAGS